MAASLVQQSTNAEAGLATTITASLTGVTSGNRLIVCIRERDGTAVSSISDTVNGSWTLTGNGVTQSIDDARVAIYSFPNSGAGNPTVTVTMAGTAPKDVNLSEWSGTNTGAADNTATFNQTSGTSHAAGTFTPSASALVIAAIGFSADPGTRTPSGFTSLNIDAGAAARQWFGYATGVTGASTPTITTSNTVTSDGAMAGFLETGGGGGGGGVVMQAITPRWLGQR